MRVEQSLGGYMSSHAQTYEKRRKAQTLKVQKCSHEEEYYYGDGLHVCQDCGKIRRENDQHIIT